MKLIDSQTFLNLAKAYAGECQAYVRYRFIEYGARMENFKNIAFIIDNLGYQEFNHARMYYTFIQEATKDIVDNIDINGGYPFKEKWNLLDNLKLASEDEFNEGELIYPDFAKTARDEGFEEIAKLFENIAKVELRHSKTLKELYSQMKNDTLYKKTKKVLWKCGDCGYVEEGKEPWEKCPICEATRQSIILKLDEPCCCNENDCGCQNK